MATMKRWPLGINQPGYRYPAEYLRAQIYDAAAGGNGVGSPRAMKVVAQPAPDNTVNILPGGATVVSTYPGAEGQAYHLWNFETYHLEIPPTGSSSNGRHDLIVARPYDPQYGDYPPGAPQRELTEEEAGEYDFWDFVVYQGKSRYAQFDFPHTKLAHIRRGPNKTIIEQDDILDLRELANPQNDLHKAGKNLLISESQSLHTGTVVWPREATHTVKIPEWATSVVIDAEWGTVHTHRQASDHGPASGQVTVALTLPGEGAINTQQHTWRTDPGQGYHRFQIVANDTRPVPERFRGQEVTVELKGTKTYGPNVYLDGDSSWKLELFFKQEVL